MGRIVGGTAVSSMLVPDMKQTDPKRADFIKNKHIVAPAIPCTASGSAVAITDISPIEHTLGVKATSDTIDVSTAKLIKSGKNFAQVNSVAAPLTDIVTIFEGEISGNFVLSCDISTLGDFTNESAALFRCTLKDGTSFNSASIKYFTPVQISGVLTKVELVHWSYAKSGSVNNIQLEPGTIPTEFEPFNDLKVHHINADGTVEGVTSLYPTTVLTSNTEGVVLDVEYNADTKKYIDNIKAELQALILEG